MFQMGNSVFCCSNAGGSGGGSLTARLEVLKPEPGPYPRFYDLTQAAQLNVELKPEIFPPHNE